MKEALVAQPKENKSIENCKLLPSLRATVGQGLHGC